MSKQYYVYILTNFTNTVLYTGITNDLVRRVYEHKQKLVSGFTEKYNVIKLLYYEVFQDPRNAIKREKTIKNLLRRKKIDLIQAKNPTFSDLYSSII
ncbi:MAG: GIY-YIG nuclease family protein [Candidatus Daviesbacteria bacterium]|nr:GIY-YIG nuclease family protein [Candidatus Daviesbacteria bacterium]